jgi:hypothetical protein
MNARTISILKAIFLPIAFTILLAVASFFKQLLPAQYERMSYGLIGSVVAILVTLLFLKWDGKSWSALNLGWDSQTLPKSLLGLIMGIVLAAIMVGNMVICTNVTIALNDSPAILPFLMTATALIPLAWMEEMAFRGYAFQQLHRSIGLRNTQIIIAIVFALYHVAGGQGLASSFLGPGCFAFLFGMAMVKSGGLALPTGLHIGLNLFNASIGQHRGLNSLFVIGLENGTELSGRMVSYWGYGLNLAMLAVTWLFMERHIKQEKKG